MQRSWSTILKITRNIKPLTEAVLSCFIDSIFNSIVYLDDEDDDVGWGSDFDDDDEDSDEEAKHSAILTKSKTVFEYNLNDPAEEYQAISECMSNGSFRLLDQMQSQSQSELNHNHNDMNGDHKLEDRFQQNDFKQLNEQCSADKVKVDDQIDNKAVIQVNANVNVSPKPSPRVLPKPPPTKPEIPKNKPQM